MEVGDGLISGDETRLVRFSGGDPPSNVTSVSNTAWIRVQSHCVHNDFISTIMQKQDQVNDHTCMHNHKHIHIYTHAHRQILV